MNQIAEALNEIAALRERDRDRLREILNSVDPLETQADELKALLHMMRDTELAIASFYGMDPEFIEITLD